MSKKFIKLVLIGDSGVGKTNLFCIYADYPLPQYDKTTIGADFATKTKIINGKSIDVQIWDTAGQERFRSCNQSYYNNADGIIIIFDTTRYDTFEHITIWLDEIKKNIVVDNVDFTIIGNKTDLEKLRMVSHDDIEKINGIQFTYADTSINDKDGIVKTMDSAVERILEGRVDEENDIVDKKVESECCVIL